MTRAASSIPTQRATTRTSGPATAVRIAGHAMDRLDAAIAARGLPRRKVGLTIREIDRDAAEVIAARHGYELRVSAVDEPDCVWAVFLPRSG